MNSYKHIQNYAAVSMVNTLIIIKNIHYFQTPMQTKTRFFNGKIAVVTNHGKDFDFTDLIYQHVNIKQDFKRQVCLKLVN
jgi:hypothetical protein